MFVYEKGNSLNLTFGNAPVENPEVIIKGYENGASLTVNGTEVVSVANAVEFEGKAKTFVYQKDGKLMITFRGIEGMSDPEVTIDETAEGVYSVVANGSKVDIQITEEGVSTEVTSGGGDDMGEEEEVIPEEPAVEPEVEPESKLEEPEEPSEDITEGQIEE